MLLALGMSVLLYIRGSDGSSKILSERSHIRNSTLHDDIQIDQTGWGRTCGEGTIGCIEGLEISYGNSKPGMVALGLFVPSYCLVAEMSRSYWTHQGFMKSAMKPHCFKTAQWSVNAAVNATPSPQLRPVIYSGAPGDLR